MAKLSNEKLAEKYRPLIENAGIFVVENVIDINYNPHPFTIGPRHVAHAADHHGGMLGEATMEAIPCAANGCRMALSDHTFDKVMALKFIRNATKEDAQASLEPILDEMIIDSIDGFVFIESEFNIIEEK